MKNDDIPELRHLNTLVCFVENGSFSAAARKLAISQPSVSQQMRRLEAWIGAPIVSREGASAKLTPDGEALLVFARAIIALSAQATAHFRGAEQRGSVRLGLNELFAATAVPRVLALFSQMHAGFELVMDVTFDTPRLFKDLDEGRLDLVVTGTKVTETRGDVLEIVPLVWVGRTADMRLPDGPVPLVAVTPRTFARDIILAALAEAGRDWVIRVRSQNLAALDAAVSAGVGVAAAMKGLKTGSAVVLDEACGLPKLGEVALCLDVAKNVASPAHASFADFFKKVIIELDLTGRHRAEAADAL